MSHKGTFLGNSIKMKQKILFVNSNFYLRKENFSFKFISALTHEQQTYYKELNQL